MTKQVFWTKKNLEAFIEEGNLNVRQEKIMRSRAKGDSIVKIADDLHLSVDQVNKEISMLKKVYDVAQATSDILPPRRKCKSDLEKSLSESK